MKENVTVPEIIGRAIQQGGIEIMPEQHQEYWQIVSVPHPEKEGETLYFAGLVVTTLNGLNMYWYDPEDLTRHVQQARQALAALEQTQLASKPLVVANETQMKSAIGNLELTNRNLLKIPGQ